MSGTTAIEWTDRTWNPTIGCIAVSPGCDRCYARVLHDRRHAIYQANAGRWSPDGKPMPAQYARPFVDLQLIASRLQDPLHWKRPQRIFVNSVSDLFHQDVPTAFLLQVFRVMAQADWHVFQILTKRPSRAVLLAPQICEALGGVWPGHILFGVSVESAAQCWRVDKARQVPAPYRFISAEPLLGDVTLDLRGISWVIVGAESGTGARPMEDAWVRHLRDQCLAAGVSFFFKQRATPQGQKVSIPDLDGQTWQQGVQLFLVSLKAWRETDSFILNAEDFDVCLPQLALSAEAALLQALCRTRMTRAEYAQVALPFQPVPILTVWDASLVNGSLSCQKQQKGWQALTSPEQGGKS